MGRKLAIAIAGARTAGLSAGAILAGDGHDVRIFERFRAPAPVGAGLLLQPTGLAVLATLGVDGEAMSRGARIDWLEGCTVRGRPVLHAAYSHIAPHLFGIGIHRATLFELLHGAAMARGVHLQPSTSIVASRLVSDGRVLVDAAGDEHGPFDLVIDATGTRSALRQSEARVRLDRPYPYGAVWGVVRLPEGWARPRTLLQRYDRACVMIGILPVGRRPEREGSLAAFFWSLKVADYQAWRAAGLMAWQERVTRLWPEAGELARQFQSVDDLSFASYADVGLERTHADRLVLVGDAAHATSPQLGQGANLAMVDALLLGDALRKESDLAAALARHSAERLPHTRFYSRASRWLTPFYQSDSRVAALLRDHVMSLAPHVPFARRLAATLLTGVMTGPFGRVEPGEWASPYRVGRAASGSSQPS